MFSLLNYRYIFCKFLVNPTSILKLTISSESQWTDISNNIVSVWKYCPLFTRVKYKNTFKNAIQANGDEKLPKPPTPLGAHGPHLIQTSCDRPHSPPQMTTRSVHALSHNYATKSPSVTNGCPTFTTKQPLPLRQSQPTSNTPIRWPTPLITLNSIQIQTVVFPHFTHQTDKQTDERDWRQVCINTRLRCIVL